MKIYFAWVIALGGLLLSFYYSEVKGYEPCRLCWLQRLSLFPLAIQLGIGAYREDSKGVRTYALPLAFFGCSVAFIQLLLPWLPLNQLCGAGPDCSKEAVFVFGTIPFAWLSTVGFFLITLLIYMTKKRSIDS